MLRRLVRILHLRQHSFYWLDFVFGMHGITLTLA